MEQIILIVHLLIALAIIGLIMIQQGKGADMGASFGAGASQTLFGSDGSGNVLTRSTSWLVVLFFSSSFGLALLANQKSAVNTEVDLGLELPTAVESVEVPAEQPELPVIQQEDLPVMNDDLPQAIMTDASSEIDVEEDLPQLD